MLHIIKVRISSCMALLSSTLRFFTISHLTSPFLILSCCLIPCPLNLSLSLSLCLFLSLSLSLSLILFLSLPHTLTILLWVQGSLSPIMTAVGEDRYAGLAEGVSYALLSSLFISFSFLFSVFIVSSSVFTVSLLFAMLCHSTGCLASKNFFLWLYSYCLITWFV